MPVTDEHVKRNTTQPCQVHTKHIPASHINERHHVWPLGKGGPDVPDNRIVVCATGHNNIHTLLTQLLAHNGAVPYSVQKQFSMREREYAKLGFERIQRGAL